MKQLTKLIAYALTLGYCLFYVSQQSNSLNKSVFWGGDEWEYQSIAVNFALNNEFMLTGKTHPIAVYGFDTASCVDCDYIKNAFDSPRHTNYREPIYPLVLGLFYKAVGIVPIYAKQAQLLLLLFISLSLPFWGRYLFEKTGWYVGCVAAIVYLRSYAFVADYIMTETLATTILLCYTFYSIKLSSSTSIIYYILWGILSGLVMLTKGILLPVPLVFLTYYWFKNSNTKKYLFIATIFMLAIPTLYSYYSAQHTGQFVFITNQGTDVLLSGNNEWCLDGAWHPEWQKSQTSYYTKNDCSSPICVLQFYISNPDLFIPILLSKMKLGLTNRHSFHLLLVFFWISFLGIFIKNKTFNLLLQASSFCWIVYYMHFNHFTIHQLPNAWLFVFSVVPFVYLLAWVMQGFLASKKQVIMGIYLLLPILFNLVFYGLYRFSMPFDWIAILIALWVSTKWGFFIHKKLNEALNTIF